MKWVSHDIVFLWKPPGGEYHLIFRDWGTNQIARKAPFTCVVYTKRRHHGKCALHHCGGARAHWADTDNGKTFLPGRSRPRSTKQKRSQIAANESSRQIKLYTKRLWWSCQLHQARTAPPGLGNANFEASNQLNVPRLDSRRLNPRSR